MNLSSRAAYAMMTAGSQTISHSRYALDFGCYEGVGAGGSERDGREEGDAACLRGAPKRYAVESEGGTLGKSRGCAVQVNVSRVSRRHAEIRKGAAGGYAIYDLGSTHGTRVNGAKVGEEGICIAEGDLVELGGGGARLVVGVCRDEGVQLVEEGRGWAEAGNAKGKGRRGVEAGGVEEDGGEGGKGERGGEGRYRDRARERREKWKSADRDEVLEG